MGLEIYNAKLEQSSIKLSQEELQIIEQFRATNINVTELCDNLGKYGLQVLRISDSYIRLQADFGSGNSEATISFEVEL